MTFKNTEKEIIKAIVKYGDKMNSMAQVINESQLLVFRKRKLKNVEDDREVRNLIFNMLQMDNDISDMEIQKEVIERFGDEYPGMSLNDWRHIIEDYTSIVRIANQRKAKEIYLDLKMAASPENEEE